jgi:hypothetical protein
MDRVLLQPHPANWLISIRMVEISHSVSCNFSSPSEFEYVGASDGNRKADVPAPRRIATTKSLGGKKRGFTMKYLRYFALLAILALPLAYAQAEVRVGVGIGVGPGYVAGPPVCEYGYYPDYPYACAPYGYYGPTWFANGIFIGAGPWYHGWGHPYWGRGYGWGNGRGFYGRGWNGRGFGGRDFGGRRGFEGRGFEGRGFHGGGGSRGGGGHGDGFHGGRR